jgi:Icc-related predicted phosphoesterase
MKIAAIADLHCRINYEEKMDEILEGVAGNADVLVMAGDLTDTGLPEEAETLVSALQKLPMPKIGILGNHDHESGQADEVKRIMEGGGVTILDGSLYEIGEVGFVGTKGFCGGFGSTMVQPFGEEALKTFIRIGIEEAITLENAVAKLHSKYKVAVLHYAPVQDTLQGEPLELHSFLGSQRLGNALDRQKVDVIVHGHAHHGIPEARTSEGIPVHNVSRFVQQAHNGKCFCLIEFDDVK